MSGGGEGNRKVIVHLLEQGIMFLLVFFCNISYLSVYQQTAQRGFRKVKMAVTTVYLKL